MEVEFHERFSSVTILMMMLKIMSDFNDEAAYHISGKVSRHNCRIWDSETPQVVW